VYVAKPEIAPLARAAIVQKFSGTGLPAISFVVGNLAHPDALVAMDAVGAAPGSIGDESHTVKRLKAANLPGFQGTVAAILPGGGKYYVSGQAKNGPLPEAARATLASLGETLKFLGLDKSNVVQLKAFMQPISSADAVQAEIAKFFGPEMPPPTIFVEWSSGTNTPIEIEMIAADNKPPVNTGDAVDFLTPPELTLSKVFSRVAHVNHGQMIYISGIFGAGKNGAEEVADIFATLKGLLPRTRTDFNHLVKATYYVTGDDASNGLNDVRPRFFDPARPPAASKAVVKGVGMPGKTVTLDMIAVAK
jgi:enamine deaminase RidA (YjgF/YER057c/UK114 family)